MVLFVHLYNDFSGSPQVLKRVIENLEFEHKLFIGSEGKGVLSTKKINSDKFFYRRSNNKVFKYIFYLISQIHLFLKLIFFHFKNKQKIKLIYINTLLPFSAAIFGFLFKIKVIYHVHEISITPNLFLKFLLFFAKQYSSQIIFVSKYQLNFFGHFKGKSKVIYNPIFFPVEHIKKPKKFPENIFNIYMLASVKKYKGLDEFIELSKSFFGDKKYKFHLVCNGSFKETNDYFKNIKLPENLRLHPKTKSPEKHYVSASLVVNLSDQKLWVETFGLTILEAMSFGVPVIGPKIGGPKEIISHGKDGFNINSKDINLLKEKIIFLSNRDIYEKFSINAKNKALLFSYPRFKNEINTMIHENCNFRNKRDSK